MHFNVVTKLISYKNHFSCFLIQGYTHISTLFEMAFRFRKEDIRFTKIVGQQQDEGKTMTLFLLAQTTVLSQVRAPHLSALTTTAQ